MSFVLLRGLRPSSDNQILTVRAGRLSAGKISEAGSKTTESGKQESQSQRSPPKRSFRTNHRKATVGLHSLSCKTLEAPYFSGESSHHEYMLPSRLSRSISENVSPLLKMYSLVKPWRLAAEPLEKAIDPPRSI